MLPLLTATLSACWAAAQTSQPAASQPSPELPERVRAALAGVEDFSFSFAQPGFYAVLKYLKMTSDSPGYACSPLQVNDWTTLLERPADFRGLPITVEGLVGKNTSWHFQQEQYRHLGPVWQLELWRPEQPIAATLILTSDASDIPLGSTIRVTGYFVMIRQYYSQTKRLRPAALLVGHGPTLVAQPAARTGTRLTSSWIIGLVVVATAALLAVWVLLRRSAARARRASRALRASGPAPLSLADDLATWAAREEEQLLDDSADADARAAPDQTEEVGEGGPTRRP